ncbi:MAG: DNA polymerase III subunit delta [Dehalococcoidia bacterium]|nr:DNA polymerase III subunit delta [Dehalococcoidia bacterium]
MLYVFSGPDEFRASERLRELRASLDSDGSLSSNTSTLAGRGLTPQELLQHASAIPFLAPARLVIVEGLLGAVGNRRGAAEAWQPFLDFVPLMPETNHVVLLEPPKRDDRDDATGRSPLLAALKALPNVKVEQFYLLKDWARGGPSEVAQWLQDRAVRRGISIEPPAIQTLSDLMGANLRGLASELDKLWAYTNGRTITANDVRLLTPQSREESIFELVDAIVEGHASNGLKLLRRMLEDGSESPGHVQLLVARQIRQLVRATEVLEQGGTQDDVAAATNLRGGFPLTKLMRQARATHRGAVEAALRAVEHTDFSVKTGRLADTLALELLVVQLASLAPRHSRSARPPGAAAGR